MVTIDEELKLEVSFDLSDTIGREGSQTHEEYEHSNHGASVSDESGVVLTETGLNERIPDVKSFIVKIFILDRYTTLMLVLRIKADLHFKPLCHFAWILWLKPYHQPHSLDLFGRLSDTVSRFHYARHHLSYPVQY